MFNIVSISSLLLAAASSVSGLAVARRSAPSGYATGYLEDYSVYHTRYIALGCQNQHGTAFFDQCCHPMLASENLTTARPAQCTPSLAASSSASAAEPTSTVTTPVDDGNDQDCDDGDDDDTSAAPAATSASQAAPAAQADPTPAAAQADPTPAPATTTTPAPSEPAPTSTPEPSQTAAPSSSDSGNLISGGFATFFDQNGIAGACGTVHQDSDLICAMDVERYGDTGVRSGLCGKQVEIHNPANGKSVVVTVADACPTCNNGNSIDLSRGAFDQLADESVGIMPIEWKFLN